MSVAKWFVMVKSFVNRITYTYHAIPSCVSHHGKPSGSKYQAFVFNFYPIRIITVQVQGLSLRSSWDANMRRLVVDVPETETLMAELCIQY